MARAITSVSQAFLSVADRGAQAHVEMPPSKAELMVYRADSPEAGFGAVEFTAYDNRYQ